MTNRKRVSKFFRMPIYEYRCTKCGQFEIMQKITEPALKRCPTCQSKVTKLISNTSFQLKGSGWYITDYGRKGGGDGKAPSKETPKAESGTKSEAKSDTTTAKSDSKPSKSTESAAA